MSDKNRPKIARVSEYNINSELQKCLLLLQTYYFSVEKGVKNGFLSLFL